MRKASIALLVVVGLAFTARGVGVAQASTDPETQLAQKYAPVVRLVQQTEPCGHGEPYDPSNVDIVLGNSGVALRGPWTGSNLVKVAPTALDLSKGLFGYTSTSPETRSRRAARTSSGRSRSPPARRRQRTRELSAILRIPASWRFSTGSSTSSTTTTTSTKATGR